MCTANWQYNVPYTNGRIIAKICRVYLFVLSGDCIIMYLSALHYVNDTSKNSSTVSFRRNMKFKI